MRYVATEVCYKFFVNGGIMPPPPTPTLAGVSTRCRLDPQTQVIYQPIALVNLSCSVFGFALGYPGAFSACNLLY